MANVAINTVPTDISIPNDLTTFKTKPQVVWSGSSVKRKGTYTPNYGTKTQQTNDDAWGAGSVSSTIYQDNGNNGLVVSTTSGKSHQVNHELYGDGRWMPASIFNGCGFEVNQNSSDQHALYLNFYSLVFTSATSDSWRFWGVNPNDGHNSGPRSGYRYLRFNSSSDINTIRGWGKNWLFYGFILTLHTDGGAKKGQSSRLQAYNFKIGHKGSHNSSNYRMVPANKRSYNNRNKTQLGFSDPFV